MKGNERAAVSKIGFNEHRSLLNGTLRSTDEGVGACPCHIRWEVSFLPEHILLMVSPASRLARARAAAEGINW